MCVVVVLGRGLLVFVAFLHLEFICINKEQFCWFSVICFKKLSI